MTAAMTTDELQERTGFTYAQVKGWHNRNGLGSFSKSELHPAVIAEFLSRVREPQAAHQQTDPNPKDQREPNRTDNNELGPRTDELEDNERRTEPTNRTELPAIEPTRTDEPETNEPEETPANKGTDTRIEPKQETELKQSEPFDPGELFMFHPAARFVFVVVLMSGGAYIFASLVNKVYPDELNTLGFAIFFAVGFLVDASGLIYSKVYKKEDKYDKKGLVWFFLIVLFLFQALIESGYVFYEKDFTWIGLLVTLFRPFGQLVYSAIYLNSEKQLK